MVVGSWEKREEAVVKFSAFFNTGCGGLNGRSLHRLVLLDSGSSVSGAVWGRKCATGGGTEGLALLYFPFSLLPVSGW